MAAILLLLAAVILFLLQAFDSTPETWYLPIGLACFAAGILVGELPAVIRQRRS